MNKRVILITGASSGIGYEAAVLLSKQGHRVYGAARRVERMDPLRELGVVPVKLDVTDDASIVACVETVICNEGRIDILVNNAGYGYLGAIENVTMAEARRQMEVNLFGLARLTQLVLPYMRKQHFGRIINTSSVAGKCVILFGGWYNISKFSVEAFSDALRMEVRPFGIDVSIIEPGAIKTNWGLIAADNLQTSSRGTAYETVGLKMASFMRRLYTGNLISGSGAVAKAITRAANARCPRARYRVGRGARAMLFLHALLPARCWDFFARMTGK
ncbi:MAG: SDR family NAD(P)-dependent oxidoreductase [Paludibacteraceae bacterium]|nr:SDR family NAD(P)-dependent oxidoreductase [Paludibacteraceae bacterium]